MKLRLQHELRPMLGSFELGTMFYCVPSDDSVLPWLRSIQIAKKYVSTGLVAFTWYESKQDVEAVKDKHQYKSGAHMQAESFIHDPHVLSIIFKVSEKMKTWSE